MRAVFLDLDGTLVDSLGAMRGAYDAFLAGLGASGCDAEFDALNGPALPEIVSRLKAAHTLGPGHDTLMAAYRKAIFAATEAIAPHRGHELLFGWLHEAAIPAWLVTSGERESVARIVRRLGWGSHFAGQVTGDEVARAKPAPDIYQLALRRARLPPAAVVVVEDSVHGVRAAADAGLRVLVRGPRAHPPALASADDLGGISLALQALAAEDRR